MYLRAKREEIAVVLYLNKIMWYELAFEPQ